MNKKIKKKNQAMLFQLFRLGFVLWNDLSIFNNRFGLDRILPSPGGSIHALQDI